MCWYVYAIHSLTRNYTYIGLSSNVENRVDQHNRGKERTTKPYRPFALVWRERFNTRTEAREREKYLKSGSGKALLKEYLEGLTPCSVDLEKRK